MKRELYLTTLALMLIGCQQMSSRDMTLNVEDVSFPTSVEASQDLPITLKVGIGSCSVFKTITSERSANELRLTVTGTQITTSGTVCTQELRYETKTFVDAGTGPARVTPFKIVINQKSWGTVEVVPSAH